MTNKAWVEFDAAVGELEELLQTKYFIYDPSTRVSQVDCQEYTLPEHFSANHVDFILPSAHFDSRLSLPNREKSRKRQLEPQPVVTGGTVKNVGVFNGSLPTPGPEVNVHAVQIDTSTCDHYIISACLRLLYNFGSGTMNLSLYGIVDYTPQA